jgi:hypothetical protein
VNFSGIVGPRRDCWFASQRESLSNLEGHRLGCLEESERRLPALIAKHGGRPIRAPVRTIDNHQIDIGIGL